jgi:hypothetical protein
VWRAAGGGAGAGDVDAAAAEIEIGDSQSATGCAVLPLAADPSRGPGWLSGPMLCGGTGTWADLSFPGSAGPLAVRLCSIAVSAAYPSQAPGGPSLTAILSVQAA